MKDSVRQAFIPFTQQFEGFTTWMYLDVKGLVTIGYGNLIDPVIPAGLKFVLPDGAPANVQQIQDAYRIVKSRQDAKENGGGWFRSVTTLRATQDSIDAYAQSVCDNFEHTLATVPNWNDWPADAQLGALSIAWACGPNFINLWPKFHTAAWKGDFATMAVESHIDDTNNPGVRPRNTANFLLFQNAYRSVRDNLDRNSLIYKVAA